ncbi:15451_t:CDS:2 [Funneliformis geosporum]|nr:15451_t:CDS:2 [Funneliformis geosporum]
MKASMEAAQLVFIESESYKTRSIRYWTNYWLQNNHLPITEKCHTWIHAQGGITTPLKFKEFIENKLLINSGITRKKTISIMTATH